TKFGVVYGEFFAGAFGTGISITIGANPATVIEDIPAASAIVVDLHDSTAAGQYTGTVSSIADIAVAAGTIKTGSTNYAVTLDTYVSATGVVVIFVTSIA
ncbi:MAG: hypothetical protein RSD68_08350, partial [Oscillospiraceae bacterium]